MAQVETQKTGTFPAVIAYTTPGGWLHSRHWFTVFLLALSMRSLAAYAWPFSPDSPKGLDLTLGLAILAYAALIEVANPFGNEALLLPVMLVPALALAIMTATRATLQGMALLSSAWTFLAAMGALYLTRRQLVVFLASQTIAYVLADWFSPLQGVTIIAVVTSLTAVLVGIIVFTLLGGQRTLMQQLAQMAVSDPLTGVLNRRGAQMEAEAVRSVAERSGAPTAVALIDLDDFKALNDRHGHEAGDRALIDLTSQWKSRLRTGDVLGRIGGDEFMLILPDADEATATALIARLRDNSGIDWSCGLATWERHQPLQDALRIADERLYAAKVARKTA